MMFSVKFLWQPEAIATFFWMFSMGFARPLQSSFRAPITFCVHIEQRSYPVCIANEDCLMQLEGGK